MLSSLPCFSSVGGTCLGGVQAEVQKEEAAVNLSAYVLAQEQKYVTAQDSDHERRPPSLEHSEAKLWYAMQMDDDGVRAAPFHVTFLSAIISRIMGYGVPQVPKVNPADVWLLADALVEGADPDCFVTPSAAVEWS